jgi:hypothetical protein
MQPSVDLSSLPATLKDWRSAGHSNDDDLPRNVWNPLAPFFESLGYKLWIPGIFFSLKPPNTDERMPDGFAYRTWMNDAYPQTVFDHVVIVKSDTCPFFTQIWLESDSLCSQNRRQPGRSHTVDIQR